VGIAYHLDWVAAITALVGVYLVGRKLWYGWLVHMANLIPLTIINVHYGLWGFMPLNIVLLAIYIKNLRDWLKDGQTTDKAT
jgi:Nicotinamide mononucleotide transporter